MTRPSQLLLALTLASVGLSGCGGEAQDAGEGGTEPTRRCVAPAGLGSPQTIAAAMELINSLPEPITVACFIESLDRPLAIHATTSKLSAQDSPEPSSPRIFVFSGPLIVSISLDESGRELLEFGQSDGLGGSLKGELVTPVSLPASELLPFEGLRFDDDATTCGICHRDEHLDPAIGHPNAYISRALRPAQEENVSIEALVVEQAICDPGREPERCGLLDALLDHGDVVQREFPAGMGTIYDP